jgi:hypothetical protein
MANIRRLKQAVNNLTCLVIADCEARYAQSEEKREEVIALAESVFQYNAEVRAKINRHKKIATSKERRAYFKQLTAEVVKTTNDQFTRLSEIIQK